MDFMSRVSIENISQAFYYKDNKNRPALGVIDFYSLWTRYIDVEEPIPDDTPISSTPNVWANLGDDIDCRGFNGIPIYVDYTDNDTTGAILRILVKYEQGGDLYELENVVDYQRVLESDKKIMYVFHVEGASFIQMQTYVTTVGTTPGTISIKTGKIF